MMEVDKSDSHSVEDQLTLKIDTIDNILLNLKMISLIKPQDKLYLEDGLVKIDTPTMMQGISRWINDYSRLKTMEDIEGLINATHGFVENNFNKNDRTEEDNRECQKILVEVSKSITGIQNLKITYHDDTFIQSKLDVIGEKISEIKNKLSRSLQIS
jgi:hypothetical protein